MVPLVLAVAVAFACVLVAEAFGRAPNMSARDVFLSIVVVLSPPMILFAALFQLTAQAPLSACAGLALFAILFIALHQPTRTLLGSVFRRSRAQASLPATAEAGMAPNPFATNEYVAERRYGRASEIARERQEKANKRAFAVVALGLFAVALYVYVLPYVLGLDKVAGTIIALCGLGAAVVAVRGFFGLAEFKKTVADVSVSVLRHDVLLSVVPSAQGGRV